MEPKSAFIIITGFHIWLVSTLIIFIYFTLSTVLLLHIVVPVFFLSMLYTSEDRVECILQGTYPCFHSSDFLTSALKNLDVSQTFDQSEKVFTSMTALGDVHVTKACAKILKEKLSITSNPLSEI
ncbi:MAG: hypothetical protein KDK51_05330 [Deltaproteobacteria bacterium]|nr:hypothetical protein [Deltaproteobacteria bacterium]